MKSGFYRTKQLSRFRIYVQEENRGITEYESKDSYLFQSSFMTALKFFCTDPHYSKTLHKS